MIDFIGFCRGGFKAIVDDANADRQVEEIAKQLDDVAVGTVAN